MRKKAPAGSRRRPQQGDWFLVPLASGRTALGIAARWSRNGSLCYFFGPFMNPAIAEAAIPFANASHATLIMQCGVLGFRDGTWKILASDCTFHESEWPVPEYFGRIDALNPRLGIRTTYSDPELVTLREEACDPGLASSYPPDGLAGHIAMEWRLDQFPTREVGSSR